MYPRVDPRLRDGDGLKSLAYEHVSVRGERFRVIINRIVSTCGKRTPDDYEESFI